MEQHLYILLKYAPSTLKTFDVVPPQILWTLSAPLPMCEPSTDYGTSAHVLVCVIGAWYCKRGLYVSSRKMDINPSPPPQMLGQSPPWGAGGCTAPL